MICGVTLQPGDKIGATSHFIYDKNDPLWRYSDAPFHVACFEKWEHRAAFEAKYAAATEQSKSLRIEDI
jgi:hypothetical protein